MNTESLASAERLESLLHETEDELLELQPQIDELERLTQQLKDLKLSKQRLLTLKMSLSAMLDTQAKDEILASDNTRVSNFENLTIYSYSELSTLKTFHPDEALKQIDVQLKQKGSLNYEMFKAIVFNGGKASTEEIHAYLIECGIKQPQTGEGFESVPLTEISSRANYLVRKGIIQPLERGVFYSLLGWVDA